MLTEWSLEKHGVYLISLYKVGRNHNKKKDDKGGEALRGWKCWHEPISQEGWENVIVLSLV
jgi:hypothetical protein